MIQHQLISTPVHGSRVGRKPKPVQSETPCDSLEPLGERSLVSGGIAERLQHEPGAWVILSPHIESLPQSRASTEENSAWKILEGTT